MHKAVDNINPSKVYVLPDIVFCFWNGCRILSPVFPINQQLDRSRGLIKVGFVFCSTEILHDSGVKFNTM